MEEIYREGDRMGVVGEVSVWEFGVRQEVKVYSR